MDNKLANFLGITKKSGNLIHGNDDVINNFFKNNVKLILAAKDTSENTLKKLKKQINDESKIKIINLSKEDIEQATGKFSAILGVLDGGLASEILKLLSDKTREEI